MIDKTNFNKIDCGWELNNSNIFFGDKEVAVVINTKSDSDHPDKEIFDGQMETLNIVAAWDELSAIIEQEIASYEGKTREEILIVANSPRIFLDMDYDTNLPTERNQWSFILGVKESEDFGWHVEFEGTSHLDTWAGG
ncbi:MAG: hypothetical protein GC181_06750 [Bacteroidetes bacterium]|nr:hypothetical protein [Bacteroidota bacterium]